MRTGRVRQIVDQILGDGAAPPRAAIVGADGSGRTEVLDAVADALRKRGATVVDVAARRLERDVAYGALEGLVDQPNEGSKGEQAARAALLDRLAGQGATVIVDDAHWLDPSSLHTIVGVAERAGERGVGVVVAHRPIADRDIAALDGALAPMVVRLESLDNDGIAERAAVKLDAAVDDALVDALLTRTEGFPLLLDTLIAGWSATGALDRGSLRDGPPAELPASVVEFVRARVDQLPDSERRLLVVLSLGSALDDDLVAGLAEVPADELGSTTEGLRAAGLLVPGHDEALPLVADAVLAITPEAERRRLHGRCADALTARGDPPARAAEHVIASGATGPGPAVTLVAAADAALSEGLAGTAGELLDRAAEMGGGEVAGRRAEAAALTGDLDGAIALADAALAGSDPADRARATAVLAGVLGGRGLWGRSAQLFASVRDHPETPDDVFPLLGVPGLVALGRPDDARAALEQAAGALDRPAPLAVEAALLLARGAAHAGAGALRPALDALIESAELLDSGAARLVLPETPHGLGALTAVAVCDFTLADHLLQRALEHEAGGPGLVARHRLLLGWVSLRAGRWAQSEATLDETKAEGLPVREQILRAALDSGLARRQGDIARLTEAWVQAEPALLRSQADLFSLDPMGELAIAAARLRSSGTAVDKLAEAGAIVAALGHPPLWELPLRWASLETAVAAEDTDVAGQCATALASIAPAHGRLAGLAAAARAWVELLDGTIERTAVEAAASGLTDAGLPWEASRLTGQAAIRTTDRSVARALLERARDLKSELPAEESGAALPAPSALSEREREVADFVLDGLTHKEIGAQLFISPKTVEHHVAKIRQKLGASTRAEMLAALRAQAG